MPTYRICIKTVDPSAALPERDRPSNRPTIPEARVIDVDAADPQTAITAVQLREGERVAWIRS